MSTRSAWIGRREVVEVRFRPEVLPFERLLDAAIARSCDQQVYTTTETQEAIAKARVGDRAQRFDGALRDAEASDQLYYLGRSRLRHLPLTPMQARQVNAALGTSGTAEHLLSPRQRAQGQRILALSEEVATLLDGLTRPSELTQLADYETRLTQVLSRTEAPR